MSIQQSRYNPNPPVDQDSNICKDKDNATQKSINKQRTKVCDLLYESAGFVAKVQSRFEGESDLLDKKKCMFKWTQENYVRYRNLEITVGTEMIQTNETIKLNVANYNKLNSDLNTTLKDISKRVKEAKSKLLDLSAASCNLEICINNKCNIPQWTALTGIKPENCNYDPKQPLPVECKDAKDIFDDLLCMPKALAKDVDSIFQSSADVVGIQVFSNIETLEPLQKTLSDQSKDFEKHINEIMKLREGDMKKLQEDVIKSVQEVTKAAVERNNERSTFEGYYDTVDFICCPDRDCKCIQNQSENCEPHLKDCEKAICDICTDVKDTLCCESTRPDDRRDRD